MKTIRNEKAAERGGVTVYKMTRTAVNGERYGVRQAFSTRDMTNRDLVARGLRRARAELHRFIAESTEAVCA